MNARILLVVAALVAVTLTSATSGFTATTADRSVTVSVADDDTALLGIERTVSGTDNGTTNVTVTVVNRFGEASLSTVVVRVDGQSKNLAASGPLAPGEAETATIEAVRCTGTLHVTAEGETVRVTLNRTVPCP
jgi:hypothetical protein